MSDDAIAVVVVTHESRGEIAALAESVSAQLASGDRLIVVDNASSDGTAAFARTLDRSVAVVESVENRGFAAGCRLGVEHSTQPLILLLNPDARLEPGALERLRATAAERSDWSAWQAAVMLPDGRINTSGGVVHYLGIGWAGQCERDASMLPATPYETAFPSGAALMIRRSAWLELGGFEDAFFLYCEDVDLGLRLWLGGHRVGVEPRARVVHGYAFDKGPDKWFLLERNRWRTVLATYPAPLLAALLPMLLASEFALLAIAARGGWLAREAPRAGGDARRTPRDPPPPTGGSAHPPCHRCGLRRASHRLARELAAGAPAHPGGAPARLLEVGLRRLV